MIELCDGRAVVVGPLGRSTRLRRTEAKIIQILLARPLDTITPLTTLERVIYGHPHLPPRLQVLQQKLAPIGVILRTHP